MPEQPSPNPEAEKSRVIDKRNQFDGRQDETFQSPNIPETPLSRQEINDYLKVLRDKNADSNQSDEERTRRANSISIAGRALLDPKYRSATLAGSAQKAMDFNSRLITERTSEETRRSLESQNETLAELQAKVDRPDEMRAAIETHRQEAAAKAKEREVEEARERISKINVSGGQRPTKTSHPPAEQAPPTFDVEAARQRMEKITVSGRRSAESAERKEANQPLLDQVVRSAENATTIHTDLGHGWQIKERNGRMTSVNRGFQTFGDRAEAFGSELPGQFLEDYRKNSLLDANGETPSDIVEAVAFSAATEPVYTQEQYETRSGFLGRKVETHTRQVAAGERAQMVTNPATGQLEKGVKFEYAYNPDMAKSTNAEDDLGLPAYQETQGHRSGNLLLVRAVLPESLAAQLKAEIQQDPQVARDVVRQLVIERGGVDEAAWNGKESLHSVRPPYEDKIDSQGNTRAANRRIYIAEPSGGDHDPWTVTALPDLPKR